MLKLLLQALLLFLPLFAQAMVHLHGNTVFRPARFVLRQRMHDVVERPPDPSSLLTVSELDACIQQLVDWASTKSAVLALTGAGISTESGIPDYRGHRGSYHEGHKPILHDQFISSHKHRQRYWGRGMVGWRDFDTRQPNAGHVALRDLELIGKLGVTFEDSTDYHAISDQYYFGSGWNQVSIITQNVDHLHQRAGSQYVTELHGRTSRLKCMSCGHYRDRTDFTLELEDLNRDWLTEALANRETTTMRPDGDAQLQKESYDDLFIPSCLECESGFLKPDVVFFGDSVPLHRVSRCSAAVKNCDGLLCVGTSLAVHSALRFVKLASSLQKPIFILTVGGTRADNLPGVVKVQAPIGATLTGLVGRLAAAGEESVSIRA